MIDYLFANKPRYLLMDEVDKMYSKDQFFLLNLMETGIVSETKYGKTRSGGMITSVFATSNNIKKLSVPLMSRFFIVEIEPYTYEQFCGDHKVAIFTPEGRGRSCKCHSQCSME